MSEYLKREDVRRAVLHNEGDAAIAAIDALPVTEIAHCGECEAFERLEKGHPAGYCKRDRKGYFSGSWDIDIKRIRREDYFCRDGWKGDRNDLDEPTVTELPGWIPVTERLPDLTEQVEGDNYLVDYSKDVLVYVNGDPIFTRNIQVGRYQTDNCGGKGFTDEMFEPIHNVTHWMPMPKPPEV